MAHIAKYSTSRSIHQWGEDATVVLPWHHLLLNKFATIAWPSICGYCYEWPHSLLEQLFAGYCTHVAPTIVPFLCVKLILSIPELSTKTYLLEYSTVSSSLSKTWDKEIQQCRHRIKNSGGGTRHHTQSIPENRAGGSNGHLNATISVDVIAAALKLFLAEEHTYCYPEFVIGACPARNKVLLLITSSGNRKPRVLFMSSISRPFSEHRGCRRTIAITLQLCSVHRNILL
jgi:hypothetical protein